MHGVGCTVRGFFSTFIVALSMLLLMACGEHASRHGERVGATGGTGGGGTGGSPAAMEHDAGGQDAGSGGDTADAAGPLCSVILPAPVDGGSPDLHGTSLRCVSFAHADLTGADLSGADLTGAVFIDANLTDANLSGADLTGADFSGAILEGAQTVGVKACPLLLPSAEWMCAPQPSGGFVLIGPGADLVGADLEGLDLRGISLKRVHAVDLLGCLSRLPDPDLFCLAEATGGFVIIGPDVDLTGADLTGIDLTGIRTGSFLGCPAKTPSSSWVCLYAPVADRYTLVAPGALLTNADLRGIHLDNVDLTGADLTGSDLSDAVATNTTASHLKSCPASLSTQTWKCVPQVSSGFILVGPGINLRGEDLRNADLSNFTLSGFDLHGADLSGVNLTHTDLTSTDLTEADLTGADLTDALLWGDRAWDLKGCPATFPFPLVQPSGPFRCVLQPATGGFALVGPGEDLLDADLTGADLLGAGTISLTNCPTAMPGPEWFCLSMFAGIAGGVVLIGPTADITGADFTGDYLVGTDFSGIDASGVILFGHAVGLIACPAVLPSAYRCVALVNGQFAIVGFDADLTGADLTNVDFTGIDLTTATLTGVIWANTLCPDGTNSDANGNTCEGHLVPL